RGDQDANANLLRDRCQAAEKRPGFEVGPVGAARLDEVIAEPRALIAKAFEELPPLDGLLPRHVLIRADAEAEPTRHRLPPCANVSNPDRILDRSCLQS